MKSSRRSASALGAPQKTNAEIKEELHDLNIARNLNVYL